MIVTTQYVDVPVDRYNMRSLVAAPKSTGTYPGILFYSDIFQLTGPMVRACVRLAGYGFVVLAPEIYHRVEAAGSVLAFDDGGRARGLEDAAKIPVADFDRDCRAAVDYLTTLSMVVPETKGVAGFCFGGHLAFRAAFQPDIRASVCFYGTGIHNGKLGKEEDAGSLRRASEISGPLLLVWGSLDPHIPQGAREKVEKSLSASSVEFSQRLYSAEHAFMRDEGPRYDPLATDQAFNEMVSFYQASF